MGKDRECLRKYWGEQAKTGRGPVIVYKGGSRFQRGSGFGSILRVIVKSPKKVMFTQTRRN